MDWKRRCELIPDGCSTMSRMPSRHVDGFYPKTWQASHGAYCVADGKEYVEYTEGLGPVILGHASPLLREAYIDQYDKGTVYGAPCDWEAELAEKLHNLIPSADMVRFVNTGTEACMAAIKVARAATGRERIVCCGYHGWAPWYSAQSPHNAGCTEAEKGQIRSFTFNDLESFQKAVNEGDVPAAVIMEPYVYEQPDQAFLRGIRRACDLLGMVLIFDEVVTGFRTPGLTAQKCFHVPVDLTCLGKSITNGVIPMGVLCGRKKYMEMLTERKGCFVSGTFAANPLACRMALETIRRVEELGVVQCIWNTGKQFRARFEAIVEKEGLTGQVSLRGAPCRTIFEFPTPEHKALFWQECCRNSVWFGAAQFVSYAHEAKELDITENAMRRAMDIVRQNWGHPALKLEGVVPQATFRMTVHDKKN